jgi:hypothetical protein
MIAALKAAVGAERAKLVAELSRAAERRLSDPQGDRGLPLAPRATQQIARRLIDRTTCRPA